MTQLASYAVPFEAHRAVDVLAENGIRAATAEDNMALAYGGMLTGGFPVLVAEEDVERARAVLAQMEGDAKDASAEEFESLEDEAEEAGETLPPQAAAPGAKAEEREDFVEVVEDAYREGDVWARKTLSFALFGLIFFPFMLGVALRVTRPPSNLMFSPRALRHLRIARWVFGLYLVAAVFLVLAFIGLPNAVREQDGL